MSLRLATPTLRSTARLLTRQQPMGLVKIHSSVPSQVNAVTTPPTDRLHGSYHWDIERGVSLALVPIIGAQLTMGASPVTDTLLGVVLPLHLHIGFDACITDYFNSRKAPILGKVMTATLYASTAATLVGCYQFNTNDIGITEFLARVWTA
ncbi:CybS-domain-containing protein [Halteromyces radiatus]|uniref:CybS-domain-containing protein n=1 Tax=Halteromyces radiatus TaxID=101107 RepID=UPI00221E7B78|nr:CybS-domain-containing protein [Halteromyces radiatus]KAI8092939.1 CybS-domain-containing protein [Halteromyces radiatus]